MVAAGAGGNVGGLAYVVLNLAISAVVVSDVRDSVPQATLVTANPVPLAFWKREVLVRTDRLYGSYISAPFLAPKGAVAPRPIAMADPRLAKRVTTSADARAFLFWSRMPIAELDGESIILKDQRFLQTPSRGPFTVILAPQ